MRGFLDMLFGLALGLTVAVHLVRATHETPVSHMNSLISVGFTMHDPDGGRIEYWCE